MMKAAVFAALVSSSAAFAPSAPVRRAATVMSAEGGLQKAAAAALAAGMGLNLFSPMAANAITKDEINSLTYQQVKGTGLANRCAEPAGDGQGAVTINGKQQLVDLCLEPKQFLVEEEVSARAAVDAAPRGAE